MTSQLSVERSELYSTLHDRERRQERDIKKILQKEARRYGMTERQKQGRIKCTYAGHVVIFDDKVKRVVTSWKIEEQHKSKKKEYKSGTRFQIPLMLQKSEKHEKRELKEERRRLQQQLFFQREKWKSHTVIVVDMSGSMQIDDVNGARCRSDAVWTSLAKNFVRNQLDERKSSIFDLVSIVTMRKKAEVIIRCEPIDWVLYNKLVDLREWDTLKPHGHGFYKPSLIAAEDLLNLNDSGSCALGLIFFSDGKPSDYMVNNGEQFSWRKYAKSNTELVEKMGAIASRFGRRLSISCIGIADDSEEFDTLKRMAEEAAAFGAQATFNQPSLNSDALSQIISSSVTSSTISKTELTNLKTGSAKSVRSDIVRERRDSPDDEKLNGDWRVFSDNVDDDSYTRRVRIWNEEQREFAVLVDPRCNFCSKMVANESWDETSAPAVAGGALCRGCKACFFCHRCMQLQNNRCHDATECRDYADARRKKLAVTKWLPSYSVAWKKHSFGEGAERVAFKFRFLNKKKKFIGPVMVAKESRFIEDLEDVSEHNRNRSQYFYHKSFMRTQAIASNFSRMFNEIIERVVPRTEEEEAALQVVPRLEFLEPFVFELEDTDKTFHVLVEKMIPGNYKKYIGNQGEKVQGMLPHENEQGMDGNLIAQLLGQKITEQHGTHQSEVVGNGALDAIVEEESDEESTGGDSSDDEEGQEESDWQTVAVNSATKISNIPDEDFLHAFTHFSYVRSRGKIMVVDLQGALNVDGSKKYMLTDPAIHSRYRRYNKRLDLGRTNLGRKGIYAFLNSHECNDACRLIGLKPHKEASRETRATKSRATANEAQGV